MKKRSLAGFGDVANIDEHNNINDNKNNNINNNNNNNGNIMEIIMQPKSQKTMIGIYFEPHVAKVLRQVAGKGGKGAQSRLVNEVMKKYFQDQNLL